MVFAKAIACFKKSILFILIISASLSIYYWGTHSDVYLGDESFHYRLTDYIYKNGLSCTPLYDPLALTNPYAKNYYTDPMLWHRGLAFLWKFAGVSQKVAQLYQIGWYIFLLLGCYLLTKAAEDKKSALWALLLTATLPVSVALSIVLHTDIPIAAISAIGFYFLVRNNIIAAILSLSAMVYIKRSAYFFIPIYLIYIYILFKNKKQPHTYRNLIAVIILFLILISPQIIYQVKTFGYKSLYSGQLKQYSKPTVTVDARGNLVRTGQEKANDENNDYFYKSTPPVKFYDESNLLLSHYALFKYYGIVLFLAFAARLFYRNFKAMEIFFLYSTALYIALFLWFFKGGLNVRYLTPIIPVLVVLAASGISRIRYKAVKIAIFIVCIAQFLIAGSYTYRHRIIPDGLMKAYDYIKDYTAQGSRFMCTQNALSLYTNRYSIWMSKPGLHEISYLFWKADEPATLKILQKYGINYILIEKNKIYDYTQVKHTGGYPLVFVEKIRNFKNFEMILDNKDAQLWKIKT